MKAQLRHFGWFSVLIATVWFTGARAQGVPTAPPVANPATGLPDNSGAQPASAPSAPVEASPSAEPATGTSHPDDSAPMTSEPAPIVRLTPRTADPAASATAPAAAAEASQPAARPEATASPAPQPPAPAAAEAPAPEPPAAAPAALPAPTADAAPAASPAPAPVTAAPRPEPTPVSLGEGQPPAAAPRGVLLDRAWSLLTENAAAGKNPNDRIQAMAALGSMGNDDRAARLISDAFTSKEIDVRIAAILAAAETKNPRLESRIREAFDDPDPQVAYTAAVALWNNHDKSGEDLLIAVAEGDRKASEGLMAGAKRKGQEEIHNPKLMATQGLEAGAGFAFGPAGIGVKAVMYAKGQGGAAARAAAVNLLAQSHTEQVHRALVDCISDKEAAVRAACAKGLGNWPGAESAGQLGPMLDDNKLGVRLMAAAGYIRASGRTRR